MKLTTKQREVLRTMFGGKCAYCGCELGKGWHADHIKPVQRKMKYGTDPNTGYGRLVDTGEVYCPERDCIDNLFPSCQPCNTHKGSYSLEGWRGELERITGVLQRGYPTYRHAVRFGQVVEQSAPIVFWFEKCRMTVQEEAPESTTVLASAIFR